MGPQWGNNSKSDHLLNVQYVPLTVLSACTTISFNYLNEFRQGCNQCVLMQGLMASVMLREGQLVCSYLFCHVVCLFLMQNCTLLGEMALSLTFREAEFT